MLKKRVAQGGAN